MTIKFNLTAAQYQRLWTKHHISTATQEIDKRFKFWDENIKPKFSIEYIESIDQLDTDKWFGVIVGSEDRVNWFLLSL